MGQFAAGWRIQVRVIKALMIRELTTRFGRENIGFLWIMAEPLLFATLVGVLWRFMKGPEDHGINVIAFVATGYIPLVMFRTSVNRAIRSIGVNASLMYHRQIKILDLTFVRFLIEFIGHMMAYLFIGIILIAAGQFPIPHDIGFFLLGWTYYALFTLGLTLIIAPLSELSEVLEKLMPVTTYMMVPFSGAFNNVSWLTPAAQEAVLYSPPVHGMEMMRYGIFGDAVSPHYEFFYPLAFSMVLISIGLLLSRTVRRKLVIE